VALSGLDFGSLQSDRAIAGLLERFGARVEQDGDALRVRPDEKRALTIDASQCPDLFPVLAVLACGAAGTTRIENAARLRLKESDRIDSVARMLADLGASVTQTRDSLLIHGTGSLRGGGRTASETTASPWRRRPPRFCAGRMW
jgi:3-phosphoshikimate 1-carboxyvinyltransferase